MLRQKIDSDPGWLFAKSGARPVPSQTNCVNFVQFQTLWFNILILIVRQWTNYINLKMFAELWYVSYFEHNFTIMDKLLQSWTKLLTTVFCFWGLKTFWSKVKIEYSFWFCYTAVHCLLILFFTYPRSIKSESRRRSSLDKLGHQANPSLQHHQVWPCKLVYMLYAVCCIMYSEYAIFAICYMLFVWFH